MNGNRVDEGFDCIVVLGRGAIGAKAAELIGAASLCRELIVVDSSVDRVDVESFFARADLVVEATTVEAGAELVPAALAAGCDVVVCSCGMLCTDGFVEKCRELPGRLLIPAGAIGGLDILAAATRSAGGAAKVRHTTVKRPRALGVAESVSAQVEVFRGTARQAVQRFPRTSNSSVALALATVGLDGVEVVVRADPTAHRTRHEIEFHSAVGDYFMAFENAVDSSSGGRTSAITAWSVVELVRGLRCGVGPGLAMA